MSAPRFQLLLTSDAPILPGSTTTFSAAGELTSGLASGSYLAISHWRYHPDDEDLAKRYSGAVHAIARRDQEHIAALLPASWETVEPGLVPVTAWRPESSKTSAPETAQVMGGVVRKP